MNDAGLVVEARAGNLKAFAALYDRHAGGIHDLLRSVTGDDSIAREVLHDTFVVAGSPSSCSTTRSAWCGSAGR